MRLFKWIRGIFLFSVFIMAALFFACSYDEVYYQYLDAKKKIERDGKGSSFCFRIDSLVPSKQYDISFETDYLAKYRDDSLTLIISTNLASGNKTEQIDTIRYGLYDQNSNSFSLRFKHASYKWKENLFLKSGNYIFTIVPNSSNLSNLSRIEKIGLRVTKSH